MGEYVKYRKTSTIEVVGKTETGMIVQNVGAPDDRREVPFAVFKASYVAETHVANPQLENNFSYHAPKPGQPEIYEQIRNKAKELAYLIDDLVLNSREKSLAMTNLEQAVFWANASVARN
ncbi:hypothetical protein PaeBR_18755 [Paenibacillus sp. BR2-3]|uniref:Acb2/Tad1 domain-containing protein n=1 Tax=Paenibacillus sp. BR2-3 TaxID=3048494 RepID=UPI003977634C